MKRAPRHPSAHTGEEAARRAGVRTLTMEQWCALARDGSVPAMTVPLEGDSMRPLIRKGRDPVTIVPVRRDLMVGDVVLFVDDGGRYVVHRVWRLGQSIVQTLGDNSRYPEPWFSRERVLGMAVSFRRNGRTHRLDTRRARAWGRVWMATHPVRLRAALVADAIAGRSGKPNTDEGEGARDGR